MAIFVKWAILAVQLRRVFRPNIMVRIHHSEQQDTPRHDLEDEIGQQVLAALVSASRATIAQWGAKVLTANGRRVDRFLELRITDEDGSSQNLAFAIEIVRHAYPRDISAAMWQLKEYLNSVPANSTPVIPMIAAQSLSPGAKDLLRQNNVAYFDLQGSLYLRWRHWLIDVQQNAGAAVPKPVRGKMDLFTDARARVVHALLLSKRQWVQVTDLAKSAKVSAYTCSMVLQELEKREWCVAAGSGPGLRRQLVKPNALLDAWADAWTSRKEERTHWYMFAHPQDALIQELTTRLGMLSTTIAWAFTGAAPANSFAPLLTSVSEAEIIVPLGEARMVAECIKLERAEKGFNVTIHERDQASLLFRSQERDGAMFASPIVLYLDLLNGRGRNKELAHTVREKLELGRDGD
jgi:hypothetical protein